MGCRHQIDPVFWKPHWALPFNTRCLTAFGVFTVILPSEITLKYGSWAKRKERVSCNFIKTDKRNEKIK